MTELVPKQANCDSGQHHPPPVLVAVLKDFAQRHPIHVRQWHRKLSTCVFNHIFDCDRLECHIFVHLKLLSVRTLQEDLKRTWLTLDFTKLHGTMLYALSFKRHCTLSVTFSAIYMSSR